jgi:hypothetical protein
MSYSLPSKQVINAVVLGIVAPAIAACGGPSSFAPSMHAPSTSETASGVHSATASSWTFSTLDNPDHHDFNALNGINNVGKIAGFTGDGSGKNPDKGYVVSDYGKDAFRNQNFPGAADTVVTSLSNTKSLAGYYTSKQGWIFGFILQGGIWTSYKDPKLRQGSSNVTELLGLNDAGLAVGFYTDQDGVDHAFELNATTGKFHGIVPPGAVSVEATGINGKGDIAGIIKTKAGVTRSWLLKGGSFTEYSYPHSANTQARAINWQDQMVGSYVDGSGKTHGFLLSTPLAKPQWQQIDEPRAEGATVVTSIEDHDYMVGYYVAGGYTNGFLATPK